MNTHKPKTEQQSGEWIELNHIGNSNKKQQYTTLANLQTADNRSQSFEVQKIVGYPERQKQEYKLTDMPPNIGMTKRRNMIYHKKASKIPTMYFKKQKRKVTCSRCGHNQSISGTKKCYVCEKCGQKEECQSTYGVIGCKQCQKKVMFLKGMVKQVRCTNCRQINECKQSCTPVDLQNQL